MATRDSILKRGRACLDSDGPYFLYVAGERHSDAVGQLLGEKRRKKLKVDYNFN